MDKIYQPGKPRYSESECTSTYSFSIQVYYAYSALMQNEFVGRSLQCPGGVCAYPSGDYVVSFYSVDRISILGACFTIFGFSCCYMIAGLIALRHTAKPQMMII